MRSSTSCDPTATYLYGAMHDGAEPEFGTFRTSPWGRAPFTFTSFGDQGTPTLGRKYVPSDGRDDAEPALMSMTISARRRPATPRWAWSGCSPCSTCSTAISVTPTSPRTACAPGGISGTTTAAAPATVPGCRQPATTRTSSATDRSGIRPIRPTSRCRQSAGQTDVTRGLWYAFTVGSVRVDQHRQRRCRLSGRRQFLRSRLFAGRAEGVAGEGTGRGPRQSRHRLDRGVHAPGRHLDRRQVQRRRSRHPARSGCRCSTNTASTSWCAGTSTTTSARIRSAAGNPTRP